MILVSVPWNTLDRYVLSQVSQLHMPSPYVNVTYFIVYIECDVNPCENNGTYQSLAGSYICNCSRGFSGLFCEQSNQLNYAYVCIHICIRIVLSFKSSNPVYQSSPYRQQSRGLWGALVPHFYCYSIGLWLFHTNSRNISIVAPPVFSRLLRI